MLETVTSPSSEQGMFALSWGWFVHLLIFYLSLSPPGNAPAALASGSRQKSER